MPSALLKSGISVSNVMLPEALEVIVPTGFHEPNAVSKYAIVISVKLGYPEPVNCAVTPPGPDEGEIYKLAPAGGTHGVTMMKTSVTATEAELKSKALKV
jgi:hypothetical protein